MKSIFFVVDRVRRLFRQFAFLSIAMVTFSVGLLVCASAEEKAKTIPTTDSGNAELKAMFNADQAERTTSSSASINWQIVGPRDRARELRVKELYHANQLRSGRDYYRAALILQHGEHADDYLLAHEFCIVAISLGEPAAKWLAAATEDRFLLTINRAQRFGTQYDSGADGRATLEKMDDSVTDGLRQLFDVPAPKTQPTKANPRRPSSPAADSGAASAPGPAAADIAGRWQGVAPNDMKIEMVFLPGGRLEWTVGENAILHGRFTASRTGNMVDVDLWGFDSTELADVRFLGLAKIDGDKMILVCSRVNGGTPSVDAPPRPKEFDDEAITFHRSKS